MAEPYSVAQVQRLVELNAGGQITGREFSTAGERDAAFKEAEQQLVRENKEKLAALVKEKHLPLALKTEGALSEWLTTRAGFTRVATPIIITAEQLDKMTIGEDHPLRSQVFWLDRKRCLRPMLAPNLYIVMRDMYKILKEPVRIFEAGSCFRKESQGAQHMNEFTMLNLVEMAGVEDGGQLNRLKELATGAMEAAGIDKYELVTESSEVYGWTLDIEVDGLEVASGAYGPLPMDSQWEVFEPWVGLGLGIERIAMIKGQYQTIKRAGKSIVYVDGVPLKL